MIIRVLLKKINNFLKQKNKKINKIEKKLN